MAKNEKEMINMIKLAQAARKLVTIVYEKMSTGRTVKRTVEPYEIRNETLKDGGLRTFLYGFDVTEAHHRKKNIKRWNTANLFNVFIEDKEFTPRWDVKISKTLG